MVFRLVSLSPHSFRSRSTRSARSVLVSLVSSSFRSLVSFHFRSLSSSPFTHFSSKPMRTAPTQTVTNTTDNTGTSTNTSNTSQHNQQQHLHPHICQCEHRLRHQLNASSSITEHTGSQPSAVYGLARAPSKFLGLSLRPGGTTTVRQHLHQHTQLHQPTQCQHVTLHQYLHHHTSVIGQGSVRGRGGLPPIGSIGRDGSHGEFDSPCGGTATNSGAGLSGPVENSNPEHRATPLARPGGLFGKARVGTARPYQFDGEGLGPHQWP